jgi:hypothetical protein
MSWSHAAESRRELPQDESSKASIDPARLADFQRDVYFEEFHAVLLVTAYAKGRKEDLTDGEKAIIAKAIGRIHESLSKRYVRQRRTEEP